MRVVHFAADVLDALRPRHADAIEQGRRSADHVRVLGGTEGSDDGAGGVGRGVAQDAPSFFDGVADERRALLPGRRERGRHDRVVAPPLDRLPVDAEAPGHFRHCEVFCEQARRFHACGIAPRPLRLSATL